MLIEYRIRFERGSVVVSQNITGGAEPFGGGGAEPFGGGGAEPFGGGGAEPFGGGEDQNGRGGAEPFGGRGRSNGFTAIIFGPIVVASAPVVIDQQAAGGERIGRVRDAERDDLLRRPESNQRR